MTVKMMDTIKIFTNSGERFYVNTLGTFYVSFLQSAIYQIYIYIYICIYLYILCTPQRHADYLLKYRSCSVMQTSNRISGIAKTSPAKLFLNSHPFSYPLGVERTLQFVH